MSTGMGKPGGKLTDEEKGKATGENRECENGMSIWVVSKPKIKRAALLFLSEPEKAR